MKKETPEARAGMLLELSKHVSRIAGSLAELSSRTEAPRKDQPCAQASEPVIPLELVDCLIRARRDRARYLPAELFAEPAWDILLDLLRAELADERISVSSACIAADVPSTTGLRWLKALEQHGLVHRKPDEEDARRTFVILSRDASNALRGYFLELANTLQRHARSMT